MKKILIVDDEEINREVLHRVLKKEGYSVDEAQDGKIALGLIEKNEYNLIFMDLDMPIMNGYEAIDTIRSRLKKEMSIIVLSANLDATSIKKVLDLGANDYINKPYNLQTMLKILREHISC